MATEIAELQAVQALRGRLEAALWNIEPNLLKPNTGTLARASHPFKAKAIAQYGRSGLSEYKKHP